MVINMMEIIESLETGKPRYISLKNDSIVKITKITVDDGEQEALYEILSTAPDAPYLAKEDQHFIYKNFVNLVELKEYLEANCFAKIEEVS
jgi:hypothetical protein